MHKLYISFGLKIISKLLSKKTAEKYEKFKEMIEKIGSKYLIILFIINVLFILFYIFILIYANVELSNNIDDYIKVHLEMKKGFIVLLLVKSNFIVKNKMEKFKYFNVLSKLQNKKRKSNMFDVD